MTDLEFMARLRDSGIIGEPDAARLDRCITSFEVMLEALTTIERAYGGTFVRGEKRQDPEWLAVRTAIENATRDRTPGTSLT